MRKTSGGEDHNVGVISKDLFCFSEGVEAKNDTACGTLAHAPVNDAEHFLSARTLSREANLSARLAGRFKHNNIVAALGRNAGSLQATGSGTHDDDLPLPRRRRDFLRHFQLTPGGRVVYAIRGATLVNAIQAIVGAHARSNVGFAAFEHFSHNV